MPLFPPSPTATRRVGGEREVVDDVLERAEAPDRAVRLVDDREAVIPGLVPRRVPSAGGEEASVRRQRRRIDLAGLPVADRQADDALERAVGQRPEPHRLVVGRGREQRAGGVDADAIDPRRVHAGLDAQVWPLVGAGLDRIVERGARLPVDRTLITASVGQPLFERLDRVVTHLGRIEFRRSRRREKQQHSTCDRGYTPPPMRSSARHRQAFRRRRSSRTGNISDNSQHST